MIAYESEVEGGESHVALVFGEVNSKAAMGDEIVPVRVHTHCLAGDVFGATLCDCRAIVDASLRIIAEAGRGALIYLHAGTRGFGIDQTVQPHRIVLHREIRGRDDRRERTLRQVGLGGQILSDLGISKIKLLTNTPTHVPALQGFGIEIVEQVAIPISRRAVVV